MEVKDNVNGAAMALPETSDQHHSSQALPFRILVADDDETMRITISELLKSRGWSCTLAADGAEAIKQLKNEYFDVVVADYMMPGNEKLQLVDTIATDFPDVPVIIMTGYPSLDSAVTALQKRVFDYLDKPLNMESLVKCISRAVEHRRLTAALHDSENRFRTLITQMPCGFALQEIIRNETGELINCRLLTLNSAFAELAGVCKDTALDKTLLDVLPEAKGQWLEACRKTASNGEPSRFDHISDRTGMHLAILVFVPSEGQLVTVLTDITARRIAEKERLKLERQVQHAQRQDSLGVLAGGIAHDFNNLLAGILGYAELALNVSPQDQDPRVRHHLMQIVKTSDRAAKITEQMLAYSGKGQFSVKPMDLSTVVRGMTPLLKTAISRNIALKIDLSQDLPAVDADEIQIRQLVMNLAINAAEAYGEEGNGNVTIRTGTVECSREYLADTCQHNDTVAGIYAYVEISDNGSGMQAEIIEKAFDPFFSTKQAGRGLGLGAVLGIVRGHKGAIALDSEPEKGTTIRILLPACDEPAAPAKKTYTDGTKNASVAGATILLVDDEEIIRDMGKGLLEEMGFTALTAEDGSKALEVLKENRDEIDCVILDLTMPRMSGTAALRELRRTGHSVPVILSSGFSEDRVKARLTGGGVAGFLKKPYRINDLLRELRRALVGEEQNRTRQLA